MRRWDGLVENYMRMCESRGLSNDFQYNIRRELDKWGCWLKRKKPKPVLEDINSEQIIGYIKSRTTFRAKSTVYSVISLMRRFGDFLVREGYWSKNPLKWIKGPKMDYRTQLPSRIGKAHMQKIWIEAANLKDAYQKHICILVLSLLYGTGMRKGELLRLKIGSWDRESRLLKIDGRKIGKERKVPLPEFAYRCLEAYLPVRYNLLTGLNRHEEECLLVNRIGRPISGMGIWKKIRDLSQKAGVPMVSLHQFRHSCASDLLEEGIGLPQVQNILGHSSMYSTYRYIQISDPERIKAMDRHPVNQILKELN